MAAIPYDVVEAFLNGKNKRRGHFVSKWGTLHSYSFHIANYLPGKDYVHFGTKIENVDIVWAPSVTTNIHFNACVGLVDKEGRRFTKVGPGKFQLVEDRDWVARKGESS